MQATMKVTNVTSNHKDSDGKPVIQVTLGVEGGGLHSFHAYLGAEEAAPYSAALLTGKPLFRLTVEPEKETV